MSEYEMFPIGNSGNAGYEFEQTSIEGLYIIRPQFHWDERGYNLKSFHRDSFKNQGLDCDFGETMMAMNKEIGTIRGFHFQRPPYSQIKLYFCLNGGWTNYSLDLRKGAKTYGQILEVEMNEDERKMLYIPKGIANAQLVRRENTRVLYQLGSKYMPEYEGGVRWDSVGIKFDIKKPIMSERDAGFPGFSEFDSPFIYGENC